MLNVLAGTSSDSALDSYVSSRDSSSDPSSELSDREPELRKDTRTKLNLGNMSIPKTRSSETLSSASDSSLDTSEEESSSNSDSSPTADSKAGALSYPYTEDYYHPVIMFLYFCFYPCSRVLFCVAFDMKCDTIAHVFITDKIRRFYF